MAAPLSPFAQHALELFQSLGAVQARRMFGGYGFSVDGLNFAIIARDRLYLKVDDETRARFEGAGCEPFVYEAKGGRRVSVGYYTAPEECLDAPHAMQPWARLAFTAALRLANDPVRKKRGTSRAR